MRMHVGYVGVGARCWCSAILLNSYYEYENKGAQRGVITFPEQVQ